MKAFELSTLLKLGIPYIVFFFAPITAALAGLDAYKHIKAKEV